MALRTYGTMQVDWEQRADLDRLRRERLAAMDVPVPFSPPLEDVTVPTPELVAQTARELVRG